MKRFVCIILVSILLLTATACTSESSQTNTDVVPMNILDPFHAFTDLDSFTPHHLQKEMGFTQNNDPFPLLITIEDNMECYEKELTLLFPGTSFGKGFAVFAPDMSDMALQQFLYVYEIGSTDASSILSSYRLAVDSISEEFGMWDNVSYAYGNDKNVYEATEFGSQEILAALSPDFGRHSALFVHDWETPDGTNISTQLYIDHNSEKIELYFIATPAHRDHVLPSFEGSPQGLAPIFDFDVFAKTGIFPQVTIPELKNHKEVRTIAVPGYDKTFYANATILGRPGKIYLNEVSGKIVSIAYELELEDAKTTLDTFTALHDAIYNLRGDASASWMYDENKKNSGSFTNNDILLAIDSGLTRSYQYEWTVGDQGFSIVLTLHVANGKSTLRTDLIVTNAV